MRFGTGMLAALCVAILGCADLLSSGTSSTTAGMPYFLPKAAFLVTLEVTKTKEGFQSALSLEPQLIADTSALYFLRHDVSAIASDKLHLQVDERGLLTSVDTTATDETPKIAATTAAILANVAKIAMGVPPTGIPTLAVAAPRPTLDEQLEKLLGKHQYLVDEEGRPGMDLPVGRLSLEVNGLPGARGARCDAGSSDGGACNASSQGVRYRLPQPTAITASFELPYGRGDCSRPADCFRLRRAVVANLPDTAASFALEFGRTPFVSVVRKASFTNGMLVGLEVERPSPVVGFLEIPLDVTERIVALPGDILNVTVKSAQGQADYLKAQLAIAEQTQKLQELVETANASAGATP